MPPSPGAPMARDAGATHKPEEIRAGASLLEAPEVPPPVRSRRLRRLVDLCLKHPLVVLRAPPGYGKTTVLRQLADRARDSGALTLWRRLEPDDADPERLARGFASLCTRREPTTADTTHMLTDLLAGLDRSPAVLLVVDDAHEIRGAAPFWAALEHLFLHLPKGVRVAVGSRTRLPVRTSRLLANGQLVEVEAESLRLDVDEVAELILMRTGRRVDVSEAQEVHALTDGWPACVSLVAGLLRREGAPSSQDRCAGRPAAQDAYDYFADELIGCASPGIASMLKRLAVLEEFDGALAAALCGLDAWRNTVDWAQSAGVLTARGAEPKQFRFHPLFREFLLGELAGDGASALRGAALAAGDYLQQRGEQREAIELWLCAGETERAADAVERIGERVLAEGLCGTLGSWLDRLAPAVLVARPRLLVLQAELDIKRDLDGRAVRTLAAAMKIAQADDDVETASRAASALVGSLVSLGRGMDAANWLRRAEESGLIDPRGSDGVGLKAMVIERAGDVAGARDLYGRAVRVAEDEGPRAQIAALTRLAASDAVTVGDVAASGDLASRALWLARGIGDAHQVVCLENQVDHLVSAGKHRDAERALREATSACLDYGLPIQSRRYRGWNLAMLRAGQGRLLEACRTYAEIEQLFCAPDCGVANSTLWAELAQVLRARHSTVRASQVAATAIKRSAEAPDPLVARAARVESVACDINLGPDQSHVSECDEIARDAQALGMRGIRLRALFHLARAHLALAEPEDAREPLRTALSEARDLCNLHYLIVEAHGDPSTLLWAVEQAIETEFALHILSYAKKSVRKTLLSWLSGDDGALRRRALKLVRLGRVDDKKVIAVAKEASASDRAVAEPHAPSAPLVVRTFGGLTVEVDGRRLEKADWVKPRCRDVLRLLVANPTHAVSKDVLMARFWPDTDESKASKHIYVLMTHLRRSLEPDGSAGTPSRFIASDLGVYSLIKGSAWVDSEQFEEHVKAADAAQRAGDTSAARQHLLAADVLYVGEYMADDLYNDAFFAQRERFRQMETKVLETSMELEATDGDGHALPQHLRRLTQIDPYNEDAWGRLMRAHATADDARGLREAYRCACRVLADGESDSPPEELTELRDELLKEVAARKKTSRSTRPRRSRVGASASGSI